MFNLIRYFLFTILFTSMGFGFIVGDWTFDIDKGNINNNYISNKKDAVIDSSNDIFGTPFNSPNLSSTDTPNNTGESVAFNGSNGSGNNSHIFLDHDKKMIMDSGKISFWFKADQFSGRQGLFSKDHAATYSSGHLTFFIASGTIGHTQYSDYPKDKDLEPGENGNVDWQTIDGGKQYLQIRLQLSDNADSSDYSYFVIPDHPIVTGEWYHIEFIFGDVDFGMRATLTGGDIAGSVVSTYDYKGGMGDVQGIASDGTQVDRPAVRETTALGAFSYYDVNNTSEITDPLNGKIDSVLWETYEKLVIVHRFDECEQIEGTKLINHADKTEAGSESLSTIKGSTSEMFKVAKIARGLNIPAKSDYVALDTGLINRSNIIDFSIVVWVKTSENGTIISTDNQDIELKILNDKIHVKVKGKEYIFTPDTNIKDNEWHQIVLTRKIETHREVSNGLVFPAQAKIDVYVDGKQLGTQYTLNTDGTKLEEKITVGSMHIGDGFVGQIDEFSFLRNKVSSYSVSTILDYQERNYNWNGKLRKFFDCLVKYDGNISITNVTLPEGNTNPDGTPIFTDFIFTVSLSEANEEEVNIDYTIEHGSAYVSNSDYRTDDLGTTDASYTGTLKFLPSSTPSTNTITVQVIGDNRVEPDEDFIITLEDPGFGNMVKGTGIGTIKNDDNLSTLSINDVNGTEGEQFNFTVSLNKAYPEKITVNYHTHPTEGSATSNEDYNATEGTITIPANSKTATITIQTIDDTEVEPTEDFYVILDNPSDNASIADAKGKGLILDNDEAFLSIGDCKAKEGDVGTTLFIFDVNLSSTVSQKVTVTYVIDDLSASSSDAGVLGDHDYNKHEPKTITFDSGEQSKTIEVEVNGDTIVEEHEKFQITISTSSSNVTLKDNDDVGIGTIINDDSSSLSINDIKKKEGDAGTITPFEFTISLNIPNTKEVKVDYVLKDGTAFKASDYNDTNGTATIPAGELNTTITVDVVGDNLVEDDEDFYVILSTPIHTAISDGNGTGTIENDDNITIEINDINLTEGDAGLKDFNFTVSITKPHSKDIKLQYYTQETHMDHNATADDDYETVEKTELTFLAGKTESKIITVHVIGDEDIENNETFHVILEPIGALPSHTYLGDKGLGTIINDDFGYPINSVTFNIERTDSGNFNIDSAKRNAWYTQVSGRKFAYDVVCYDANLTYEYPLKNVVVKIDLMENNASIDTKYAYFEANSTRAKVPDLTINEASKNVSFVVSVPNKGSLIYKHHCVGIDAEACYNQITEDPLIGSHSHKAKDNFAIRPAGYSYSIGNVNDPIIDNSTQNDDSVYLAAELAYTFYAEALRYTPTDPASTIEGYTDSNVERKLKFELGGTCIDTEDRIDNITFNTGTNNQVGYDINQTGKYTLSLLDQDWTEVDQNDNGDCKIGSSEINAGVNDRQGCNIESNTTVDGKSYTNQTITVHPHHFSVDIEETSDPANLAVIYMNSITAEGTTMSKQLDVNITAEGEKDTRLSNFIDGCMAEKLTLEYNITTNPSWNDINDSNDHKRHLYVTVNNTGLQKITQEQTRDQNGIKKDAFKVPSASKESDAGIAKVQVNYNIDRSSTATVNPVVVNFKALKVKSPSTPYNASKDNVKVPHGSSEGNIEDTFLYARVRPDRTLVQDDENNPNIAVLQQIDTYCFLPNGMTCYDADGITPSYGLYTSESSMGWWLATYITSTNTNQVEGVTLVENENKININPIDDFIIPNNPTNNDLDPANATNDQVSVTCPNRNVIAEVFLDEDLTAPWLIFGNDPYFRVKCNGISNWAGRGSEGRVIDGARVRGAAAVGPANNFNGGALSTQPNHRLSW